MLPSTTSQHLPIFSASAGSTGPPFLDSFPPPGMAGVPRPTTLLCPPHQQQSSPPLSGGAGTAGLSPLPRTAVHFGGPSPGGPPHHHPVNLLHPAAASLAYQLSNGFLPPGPFFRQFPPFAPDFRGHFFREDPKPNHSYIGLIAMAILSTKEKKMVLSDIYQWIQENYPYFRTRGPGWRNSIRHNLSLNDCFIKVGRSSNGKGHYWGVHPANMEDFKKGDFRRRRAQRKVRKALGLACPDEEDTPTPSPTDKKVFDWPVVPPPPTAHLLLTQGSEDPLLRYDDVGDEINLDLSQGSGPPTESDESNSFMKSSPKDMSFHLDNPPIMKRSLSASPLSMHTPLVLTTKRRKCGFDIDSLLAPDDSPARDDSWTNHSIERSAVIDRKPWSGMFETSFAAAMNMPKFPPYFPFMTGPGGPSGGVPADHMQRLIHQSLFSLHRPDQKHWRQSSSEKL